MVPEGIYTARAAGDVVLGESRNKGTPFIECMFQISGGEHQGQQVRWTSYFHETPDRRGKTGAERTLDAMRLCGWDGDDLSEFVDGELHGLDAREVAITVEHQTYVTQEGEERTKAVVQWVNRAGGGLNVQCAMTQTKAAGFADRMKGLVAKTKAAAAADTEFPPPAAAGQKRF